MKQHRSHAYKNYLAALAFLAPFMVIYLWFWIYPIIKGFMTSLSKGSMGGEKTFAGLDNYSYMMSDDKFWSSLWNTLYFILISTPSIVVLGLVLALIVNMKLKGTTLLRTAFFMPYMLSVSVIGSIWVFILQSRTGFIAETLSSMGITMGVSFFGSWGMGWLSILIATLWWTAGFNMILFLAGLQEIPDDLYEAADIDGAGAWNKFRFITMPSLKGVTALVVILQTISSFKLFGQTWLITKGGPGTSTTPLVHYIYQIAFKQWDTGYAAAVSFVLFLIIALISLIQYKLLMSKS
ncbi:sugar ABC transporter permease [Paenibacillus chibensis]|uniref:Sugar ABC transporter permease n=1 Tax=Paenibacillus chibensis TaxID=59846 RepID=A0ABU6PW86_9BACL|nr:sugar ABC transporter permease [Paenibacillus chibensis]MEC0370633.1 sugar ABC transporter permease [Paenibacillus chibensis]MED5019153.1 sugar ABC transporter permease [Paenibacillus chibensis]